MKRIAFVAALLVLPLITHCGSSDNGSTSSTAGQSNMAVGIQLPSGFTYDPATGAISGEFARAGVSNPKAYVGQAYITQIDVTRTGGTLASQTISLTGTPPPTSASFTVTPGEAYYFSASIYTNQPAPWNVLSGGTLSPVTAPSDGQTVSVDINILGVNGVPVVTFTADNVNPGAGTANLTCTSVDPDADTVTYLIKTVAPPAGANTLSNSNPTPGSAIAYTTGVSSQVDLECVATDSYGAIGYAKLSLNAGAVVTAPAAPTGVTATAGDAKVTVSWSASTGATSYNLYWSATPGATTASNKIAGGSSPYVHAGLTNGAVYYYAVTAANTAGESGLSAEVSATPTTAVVAPGAPTTILISGGANSVSMTWSPVANATSYNLYWSASPGVTTSNGTKIANVGTYNSQYNDYAYNHTGLTASTTYYYILTAVNAGGESAPSPQANATTTTSVLLAGLFPDANLANCVAAAFPSATTTAQVTGLLDCSNKGITNLSGIQNLTGLTWLGLQSNQIVDVTPLSSLTALTYLDLAFNSVTTGVSSLTSVTAASIYLTGNIGMPCADVTTLITALGTNVEISGNGTGNLDTPTNGVNCTSPVSSSTIIGLTNPVVGSFALSSMDTVTGAVTVFGPTIATGGYSYVMIDNVTNRFYLQGGTGALYVLDAFTGTLITTLTPSVTFFNPLVRSDGTIIGLTNPVVGSFALSSMDTVTGAVTVFGPTIATGGYSYVMIDNVTNRFYLQGGTGALYVLDAFTGTLITTLTPSVTFFNPLVRY